MIKLNNMKNEKLELLLNKVVEYNKPNGVNYKGFLYKDYNDNYFIKVVEIINCPNVKVNEKMYLKTGDEEYIIHAEKPKLMRVSMKSWHYKLVKYVLHDNAPTSKTMQNGCPYFWLLIFSLFASPFVFLFRVIMFIFLLVPEFFLLLLEKSVDAWIRNLDDVSAYDMYDNRYSNNKGSQKMPVTTKILMDANNEDFFNYFLMKKYGIDKFIDNKAYKEKYNEVHAHWDEYRNEVRAEREKLKIEREKLEKKRWEIERKRSQRIAENKKLWEARMKPFNDGMIRLFDSVCEAFTFKGDMKNLIKRTKQVVGALVTFVLLAGAFLVVEGLAYALMAFIDFSIDCWELYAGLLIIAAGVGLIYVIGVFLGGWLQKLVNEYEKGKRVWYVEPFIYLLWYPVKYIALFIAYTVLYVIYKPFEYIFYRFLWKIVLVNLGIFIWGGICSLGRGLANSTGVFGEYFGASYSDYCPGIEWVDEEEEK